MGDLEDKYLTSENMWVLNLPKPLIKPVFAVVWFFCKVKYICEYVGFLWSTNTVFDLDFLELLDYLEFKLKRMKKQLKFIGNVQGSKQVEQSLLFLEQHRNADKYVSLPKELKGKNVEDYVHFSITDEGQVDIQLNMSDELSTKYKHYIDELVTYKEESWTMFWDSLKDKATNWM